MTWLLKTLIKMSPELVEAFKDGMKTLLNHLNEMAKKTPNEWDDLGVKIIANVFDIELEDGEGQ